MSLDLVLSETTPKDETSLPVIQSNDSKHDLALTFKMNSIDVNPNKTSITPLVSNQSNDMNTSNASEESEQQKSDTKVESEHKEEVKRRRTRRARKRKHWHRLDHKRLQWTESSEQEVRRLHISCVEHGQPLAPYNTTQFIMNEHNCDKEIDFDDIRKRYKRNEDNDQSGGTNDPNDEDFYSSPEDESEYLQQQFHEAYDNIHAERLSAMNKNELVQEYLQLEDRVEDLERRLKESTNAQNVTQKSSEVQTEQLSDGQDLSSGVDEEIKRLLEENQRLRSHNERLERILSKEHNTNDSSFK